MLDGSPSASTSLYHATTELGAGTREKRAQESMGVWPEMMADSQDEECR